MENIVIKVEGMSCDHCKRAIEKAVGEVPGVAGVAVNLAAKTTAVEYDPDKCGLDAIKVAVTEEGYEVV